MGRAAPGMPPGGGAHVREPRAAQQNKPRRKHDAAANPCRSSVAVVTQTATGRREDCVWQARSSRSFIDRRACNMTRQLGTNCCGWRTQHISRRGQAKAGPEMKSVIPRGRYRRVGHTRQEDISRLAGGRVPGLRGPAEHNTRERARAPSNARRRKINRDKERKGKHSATQ